MFKYVVILFDQLVDVHYAIEWYPKPNLSKCASFQMSPSHSHITSTSIITKICLTDVTQFSVLQMSWVTGWSRLMIERIQQRSK